MIVIEKAKAIALNLNNPNRVLDVVPDSRQLTFNNQQLVVTPHTIPASRKLRMLGIKVPSPILHYYDWCGEFTPYEHQKMT